MVAGLNQFNLFCFQTLETLCTSNELNERHQSNKKKKKILPSALVFEWQPSGFHQQT